MKKLLAAGAMAFLILVSARPATAATISPALPAGAFVAGTVFTKSITSSLGAAQWTGTLTYGIWRETVSGLLDFLYQISNTSGTDNLQHVSVSTFNNPGVVVTGKGGGDNTGVGATDTALTTAGFATAGGIASTQVTGTAVIDFADFGGPGVGVAPTQHSQILVVYTNAVTFTTGNTSVTDAGTANVTTWSPLIPEPSSFVLLGFGVVGMAGYGWKRRKSAIG